MSEYRRFTEAAATIVVAASDSYSRDAANYVCDGVDDQVEIQAAIDALPGGGKVALLEGQFNISGTITTVRYSELVGQGRGTKITATGPSVFEAIVLARDSSVRCFNLTVEAATGEAGARPNGIYANGTYDLIEDIHIIMPFGQDDDGSDVRQCGIVLYGANRSRVINCLVETAVRHGIVVYGCSGFAINGFHTIGNLGCGILVQNSSGDGVISGCYLEGDAIHAIHFEDGWDSLIVGNLLETPSEKAIFLEAVDLITVQGNSIYGPVHEAIHVGATCTKVAITGNVVEAGAGDGSGHILVDAGAVAVVINGNVSKGSLSCGIVVAADHTLVTGNHVSESTEQGIYVTGDYCSIQNNVIHTAGLEGIYVTSDFALITGNKTIQSGQHGILVIAGASQAQVLNNQCINNSENVANTYDGIHIASFEALVQGNLCENAGAGAQRNGIFLDDSNDCNIDGNMCRHSKSSGIKLGQWTYDTLVQNNVARDNDQYGIVVEDGCNDNVVRWNFFSSNTSGCLQDLGVRTRVEEIIVAVPNPDGNIGDHPAFILPNAAATTVRFSLRVPHGIHELVSAGAVLVPAATGNLYRSATSDYGGPTQSYNQHTGAVVGGVVAVTADKVTEVDVTPDNCISAIDRDDWLGLAFTRDATEATDTVEGSCYLLGLKLRFV